MELKEVSNRYDGPKLEEHILELWQAEDTFAKTLQMSEGRPLFTFNEGPPTANGRPGIHHVLARTFKDIYPRYRTMRGFHCPRKAGWDTHGLPVEHEIEKELGIFDKSRIEQEVGIDEFTRRCRDSVMRYIGDWEKMTQRMGFWVDLEQAYYTLDNSFIESVWHLLHQIWDKDLIYRGYKVVPYDPRIGATLSSHEVALGYKEIDDISVYVRFAVTGEEGVSLLAWTTTPWTLPSNLALAVHPDVEYAYVRCGEETLILANALVEAVLGDREFEVTRLVSGSDLIGMRYERPFDYLQIDESSRANAWQVLGADFVTTEDGTGIVHTAPAYGVDDLALGTAHGLPVLHGVGLDGYFLPEVTPVAGLFFKEADPILADELKRSGKLFKRQKYKHNYPHGWRTGDPLIYYAKDAWYIRTSQLKQRMVELNQTINWVPQTIRDGRFGNWLENNVDWALSRERFWGTPLPVWTDGAGDYLCIGSLAELEKLCGRSLSDVDLHRPAIDEVSFVHPDNGRTYSRVPEVIDCWFDSGAMSYAQWHYPFENEDIFERHFPADYICEAIDQTRGWFYSLHAIATLVSDTVAYRNCVCLAHIVDAEGKKMSKSQGNIVDPYDVFDSVGADALRWYFTARVAPDVQKRISVDIIKDVAASFLNTLWNTYSFFVLYARLDKVDLDAKIPIAERPEVDRWILALLEQTVSDATRAMDNYDAQAAGTAIESFVDTLSNWYVRLNRARYWKASAGADKQSAYLTLYECLETTHRLVAPFMPFVSEAIYQNLVRGADPNAPTSVHMTAWPEPEPAREDRQLVEEFEVVQRVVYLGRSARNETALKVRQPLSRLLVRVPSDAARAAVSKHEAAILDELNVKSLELIAQDASLVSYRIKPNLPRVGKRVGKLVPALRAALAEADGGAIAAAAAAGESVSLTVGDGELVFEPEDLLIETESAEGYACAEGNGFLVGLDTSLSDELIVEGFAREITRSVQELRKQADLDVSDRIVLSVHGSERITAALAGHKPYVTAETLCVEWRDNGDGLDHEATYEVGGEHWTVGLSRVEN